MPACRPHDDGHDDDDDGRDDGDDDVDPLVITRRKLRHQTDPSRCCLYHRHDAKDAAFAK
jgi:hypothetical protein